MGRHSGSSFPHNSGEPRPTTSGGLRWLGAVLSATAPFAMNPRMRSLGQLWVESCRGKFGWKADINMSVRTARSVLSSRVRENCPNSC